MNRITKWITLLLGSVLIAAAALGAVIVFGLTDASAQVEIPRLETGVKTAEDGVELQHRGGGRKPGAFPGSEPFLADALGISESELQDAQAAAHLEAVEIALQEGLVTEQQAEKIVAGIVLRDYLDQESVVGEMLGMSKEELKNAHADGQRMPEILEELDLEPSDLREAMQEAFEDAVKEALDDGAINDEQAEFLLEKSAEGRAVGEPGGLRGWGKPGPDSQIDFEALLADQLNISVEQLQDARQKAQESAVNQALEDGLITEEQAALIEARRELRGYFDPQAVIEQILGVSTDELKEAHADGKRVPEILEELGLEPSDLRDAVQEAFNNAVQEALSDGVIDENQAESLLKTPFGGHGSGGRGLGDRFGPGVLQEQGGFDNSPPMRGPNLDDSGFNT